jgi:hypothetical protein
MSIKKAISLLFLLFANAVILVHATIPHRHHSEPASICFFNTYCEDCSKAYNHEHALTDSEYNTPKGKCTKSCCHSHINCNCEQGLYTLISNTLNIQDVDGTIICFRQKPCIPILYSELISQSIGLRAPPAC